MEMSALEVDPGTITVGSVLFNSVRFPGDSYSNGEETAVWEQTVGGEGSNQR